MLTQVTIFEVGRSPPCHAWCGAPSEGALLTPMPRLRGSGDPRSIQRYCCLHLLMSSVPSRGLCNVLSLGVARLEGLLLAMLLCRSPGLSSPGAYAKYEHNQDLANCLCKVLVMLLFHRSSVLVRHVAQLKKPQTH